MSRPSRLGRLAVLSACFGALAAVPAAPAATTTLAPPVVSEHFTPLPCTGKPQDRSTLQEEGCAEQRILALDRQINALSKTIFEALHTNRARAKFVTAQKAWVAFRSADCASVADVFEGGTEAAVVAGDCSAERSAERVKELRRFAEELARPD